MYISMHLAWRIHLDQWSIWSQYTNLLEICVPYVVTSLNWTHMFELDMERFIILNGRQEDACYILGYVLKLCSIILGSVGEAFAKVYVIT
jgi:hypothetical protein